MTGLQSSKQLIIPFTNNLVGHSLSKSANANLTTNPRPVVQECPESRTFMSIGWSGGLRKVGSDARYCSRKSERGTCNRANRLPGSLPRCTLSLNFPLDKVSLASNSVAEAGRRPAWQEGIAANRPGLRRMQCRQLPGPRRRRHSRRQPETGRGDYESGRFGKGQGDGGAFGGGGVGTLPLAIRWASGQF